MDPISKLDRMVFDAVRNHPAVARLVDGPDNVRVFEREIDGRDDPEELRDDPAAGPLIWIVPGTGKFDPVHTNGGARKSRFYRIGLGSGSAALEKLNELEFACDQAVSLLARRRGPDGATLTADITPYVMQSIDVGGIDPQRGPSHEPMVWSAVVDVEVHVTVGNAALDEVEL